MHSFGLFFREYLSRSRNSTGITNFRNQTTSSIMKSVLAFGNPLLDITISSKQYVSQLIQKYNLKLDGQKEISKSEMDLLSKDIEGLEKHISPGGCCQNSLRVLQWVLKKKCNVSIFGSVGKDRDADVLKNALESEGVHARYIVQEGLPTGKTVALVSGLTRSLVAHIGAAEVFSLQSLQSYPDFIFLFETTDIVFIEAYFLTNRFATAKCLVELCQSKEKLLVFNLCGDYVFKVVPESIKYLVKHANVIFGNKAEYTALTTLFNFNSIEEMATNLIKDTKQINAKTLIVTDGPHPVLCFSKHETIKITPPVINQSEIKDTTAAGDAFLGGFLAGISTAKGIKDCLNMGFYAASNIIKQRGCSLPNYQPDLC